MFRKLLLGLLASVSLASGAHAITYARYTATYAGLGYQQTCFIGGPCTTTGGPFTTTVVFTVASEDAVSSSTLSEYYAPQSVEVMGDNFRTFISPNGGSTSTDRVTYGDNFRIDFTVDPSSVGTGALPYFDTAHLTGGSYAYNLATTSGSGVVANGLIQSISTVFFDGPYQGAFGTRVGPVSFTPEPAAWAMMVLGFGAVGFAMRSRRQTRLKFS